MTVIQSTTKRRGSRSSGRGTTWVLGGVVVVVLVLAAAGHSSNDYYDGNNSKTTAVTTSLLTNQALIRIPSSRDNNMDSTTMTTQEQQQQQQYVNPVGSNNKEGGRTRTRTAAIDDSYSAFLAINERLLGSDAYGNGCHPSCGCAETPVDCPRWYNTSDVIASAQYLVDRSSASSSSLLLEDYMTRQLQESKTRAMTVCRPTNDNNTSTTILVLADETKGGWCLHPDPACTARECTIRHPNDVSFPLPQQHVVAYRRIVTELAMMIDAEGIVSISDFGAGVGQYKAKILARFPSFSYTAYDGAGNIEAYTKGQVEYFDLTVPLSLPLSDWVMCLEVGEHVPSKYEGMVIRNLHRHNKKGLILSWSVLGQKGLAHVNNHSPNYMLAVFQELGYTLDVNLTERFRTPSQEQDYWWFHESVMVLRRNDPVDSSSS